MKKRIFAVIAAVISAAFALTGFTAYAENDNVNTVQGVIDGIIDFKLAESGCGTVQEWIDGELSEKAGVSGEWYIFALSRCGSYDFSVYKAALSEYLGENEIRSASSRLKFATVLAALKSDNGYVTDVIDSSVGEQGVMSYIYGLHLLNNGYAGSDTTAEKTVDSLLNLQTDDGGWTVMGSTAENDATAMAVQALAPYYSENEAVKTAVDKSLALLSERQLENGDFASYGVPNPESTGQVLMALTSLGINPVTDERFIKNGNTLIDGILLYMNDDGSFRHEENGKYNDNSTVQTFYCLVSYLRFCENKTPLYILEKNIEKTDEEAVEITETEEAVTEEEKVELPLETPVKKADYKPVACGIIAGCGAVAVVILVILKKAKKQNLIAVLAVTLAGIIFVLATNFSSTDDYYGQIAKKENPVGSVTLEIRCDAIVGKDTNEYIPADGLILSDTFEIEEGETAFDILIEAAKKHCIQLEYSGGSGAAYITGINYIYEFDYGDLSGWMYLINGEKLSVGCDGYVLSDGDKISFLYSCEMGNDL